VGNSRGAKVDDRKCQREEEQEDLEAVVVVGNRDTMSLDAHDLPPDLEELETVEKQPLLPSNLAPGCASTVTDGLLRQSLPLQGAQTDVSEDQASEAPASYFARSDPQAFDDFNDRHPRDSQGHSARRSQGRGKKRRSGRREPVARVREHNQKIHWYLNGWTECEQCGKWRDHVVEKGVPFVCSHWDIGCPKGCDTIEDRSWADTPAFVFVRKEAGIEETEALEYSYIENAVDALVFRLEDVKIIEISEVQKFSDLADSDKVDRIEVKSVKR